MNFPSHVRTIDTHTEGQPTRIIINASEFIPGNSISEKLDYFKTNFDSVRTSLMGEPRGHRDMFGCVLTKPSLKKCDYGIFFMDNAGYMSMCGHGVIGVATALAERNVVKTADPVTRIALETMSGRVMAKVSMKNGRGRRVSFVNSPAFVEYIDADLELRGLGKLKVDIAFGGNFFVFFRAEDLHLEVKPQNIQKLINIAMRIMEAANDRYPVRHPELANSKINIASVVAKPRNIKAEYLNVHFFGKGQFDRSPGGTATCAMMAVLYAKRKLKRNQNIFVEGLTGGMFKGRILKETTIGDKKAIIPEVTGSAFITGFHDFVTSPQDPLKNGFLLQDYSLPPERKH